MVQGRLFPAQQRRVQEGRGGTCCFVFVVEYLDISGRSQAKRTQARTCPCALFVFACDPRISCAKAEATAEYDHSEPQNRWECLHRLLRTPLSWIQTPGLFCNPGSDPTLIISNIVPIWSTWSTRLFPATCNGASPTSTTNISENKRPDDHFNHPSCCNHQTTKRNSKSAQGLGERARGTASWNTDNVFMLGRSIYFPQHTRIQKSPVP